MAVDVRESVRSCVIGSTIAGNSKHATAIFRAKDELKVTKRYGIC